MASSSASSLTIFSLLTLSLFTLLLLLCEGGTSSNTATTSTTTTTALIAVDLIHRDSPDSPFYNDTQKPMERLHGSILRSFSRAGAINSINAQHNNTFMNITSLVSPDNHEYLMKFSIGTPSKQIFAMVDTGSSLVWIQCRPCNVCYKQTLPIFNPDASTTYEDLPCDSASCQALGNPSSNTTATPIGSSFSSSSCEGSTGGNHNVVQKCKYSYGYQGSTSSTAGYLAAETLTFESTSINGTVVPVGIPRVSFGCGNDNRGSYGQNWAGIVGLGRGSLSLVSQLGSTIQSRILYCLVPHSYSSTSTYNDATNPSSKLSLGGLAEMSEGDGVVSVSIYPVTNFYQLMFEGISVGNSRIDVPSTTNSSSSLGREMIEIDSGTSLTYLSPELYQMVEEELKRAVSAALVY